MNFETIYYIEGSTDSKIVKYHNINKSETSISPNINNKECIHLFSVRYKCRINEYGTPIKVLDITEAKLIKTIYSKKKSKIPKDAIKLQEL